MSGVEIRQKAASEGQRGGRRGQEGRLYLYRTSWSTAISLNSPYPIIKMAYIPMSLNKMDQYPISQNTLYKPKQQLYIKQVQLSETKITIVVKNAVCKMSMHFIVHFHILLHVVECKTET